MIRTIGETVVAFDCEWIPDANAARALFPDAADLPEDALLERLWAHNGATPEDPHPFVRLMQSRVVSVAMLMRSAPKVNGGDPELRLVWLPKDPDDPAHRAERKVVGSFLAAIGRSQPQLVGFNSRSSDLRILAQRALALGIPAKGFLSHPAKPWEGVDYFARDNDCSIDLMDLIAGGFSGRAAALSLHEAATLWTRCSTSGNRAVTAKSCSTTATTPSPPISSGSASPGSPVASRTTNTRPSRPSSANTSWASATSPPPPSSSPISWSGTASPTSANGSPCERRQSRLSENGKQSVQARSAKPSTATENGARGKRATGGAVVQSGKVAVLYVLYVLYVLPRCFPSS